MRNKDIDNFGLAVIHSIMKCGISIYILSVWVEAPTQKQRHHLVILVDNSKGYQRISTRINHFVFAIFSARSESFQNFLHSEDIFCSNCLEHFWDKILCPSIWHFFKTVFGVIHAFLGNYRTFSLAENFEFFYISFHSLFFIWCVMISVTIIDMPPFNFQKF